MKRIITIVVIVLVCVGFAFFLFKLSPPTSSVTLDTSSAKQVTEPAKFDPEVDHYRGNKDAKNVFIEYGDLQCPACRAYEPTMRQIESQFPDTVFVYRHFPLVGLHKNAAQAALAVEAAAAQGKFWEMHDKLYDFQPDWENLNNPFDAFVGYAQSVGVSDMDKFKKDLSEQTYKSRVERDNNEAIGLGLTGTPSLFFNGKPLPPTTDLSQLKQEAEPYVVK